MVKCLPAVREAWVHIPGSGRSPGEGIGYHSSSGLENSMDCIVHGAAELDVTERLSLSC